MSNVESTAQLSVTPTVGGLLLAMGAVFTALAGISEHPGVPTAGLVLMLAGVAVRLEAPIRRGPTSAESAKARWVGAIAMLVGFLCAFVAVSPHPRLWPAALVLVMIGSFLRVEAAITDRSRG